LGGSCRRGYSTCGRATRDALSSACRDKATSCRRRAACSHPSKRKFATRRTCRPSGLLNRKDSVSSARSQRCACLHAKHLHHTNAAVRLPTSPDRLSLSRHSLRRGQKKLHVPASTTLRMAPRQALPLRPAQWQVVLAAQTDTQGDPAGSGRLAWAAAGSYAIRQAPAFAHREPAIKQYSPAHSAGRTHCH
jgi:hypothetical protein